MIDYTAALLNFLSTSFIVVIGLVALTIIVLAIIDVSQTRDAVRHNYPFIGRFRTLFSSLGEFFRQYFFAMDREEMPFNRAERDWVYRSAANKDTCNQALIRPTRQFVLKTFVEKIHYGVGLIAHSCGVPHSRALLRFHCRIVQNTGKSVPLDELYPIPEVLSEYTDRI